jgi:hypothetical protein
VPGARAHPLPERRHPNAVPASIHRIRRDFDSAFPTEDARNHAIQHSPRHRLQDEGGSSKCNRAFAKDAFGRHEPCHDHQTSAARWQCGSGVPVAVAQHVEHEDVGPMFDDLFVKAVERLHVEPALGERERVDGEEVAVTAHQPDAGAQDRTHASSVATAVPPAEENVLVEELAELPFIDAVLTGERE